MTLIKEKKFLITFKLILTMSVSIIGVHAQLVQRLLKSYDLISYYGSSDVIQTNTQVYADFTCNGYPWRRTVDTSVLTDLEQIAGYNYHYCRTFYYVIW